MNLEIKSFADGGDIQRERLVIRVLKDEDIGEYVVLRSKATPEGAPISGSKRAYWFPDKRIKAGDLVVLYTRAGKPGQKPLSQGGTAYFYYWSLNEPIWGADSGNTAVLLTIGEWTNAMPG